MGQCLIYMKCEIGVLQRQRVRRCLSDSDGSVSTAAGNPFHLWGKPQGLGREVQTGETVSPQNVEGFELFRCLTPSWHLARMSWLKDSKLSLKQLSMRMCLWSSQGNCCQRFVHFVFVFLKQKLFSGGKHTNSAGGLCFQSRVSLHPRGGAAQGDQLWRPGGFSKDL